MSFLWRKTKEPPKNATEELQSALDLLTKKCSHIESKITKEANLAKSLAQRDKKSALLALRRKKKLENQLEQLNTQVFALEHQLEAHESVQTTIKVAAAMSTSTKAMKETFKHYDIDSLANAADDQLDITEKLDEFNYILKQNAQGSMVSEEDLLKELQELEQEDLDASLSQVSSKI
ncbi:hypothetical protein HZS_6100, partial [Henneguya salminicola]